MTINYYAPFGDGTYWRNITDLNDTTYGQIAIIDGKRKLVVGDKIGELCLVGGKRRYWVEGEVTCDQWWRMGYLYFDQVPLWFAWTSTSGDYHIFTPIENVVPECTQPFSKYLTVDASSRVYINQKTKQISGDIRCYRDRRNKWHFSIPLDSPAETPILDKYDVNCRTIIPVYTFWGWRTTGSCEDPDLFDVAWVFNIITQLSLS